MLSVVPNHSHPDLGPFSPDGWAWALTFDKPGTYEYDCPVHREQGMKGTIEVQAR